MSMIDYFALALSHGLLALAAWRLLHRDALDREEPGERSPQASPAPPSVHRLRVPPRA